MSCIYIECKNGKFLSSLCEEVGVENSAIRFSNKYYEATVAVTTDDREYVDVVAHIVVYDPNMDVIGNFKKFPLSEIRVLVVPPELVSAADKMSQICLENSAEIFLKNLK